MNTQIKKLSYAALCLALALVLPFLTGQIPTIGAMLSPMHIPVLLCGFLCGWQWGLAVGFVAPVLRSVLFGMPKLYPTALAMMCELAVYGAATGFFYRLFPRRPWRIYLSLVLAMLLGRIVWGCAQYFLLGAQGTKFTWQMFAAGAFINAVPGIILHLILIPAIVYALEKAGYILNNNERN